MALIGHLNEHGMGASSIRANQPSTSRLVIVQDIVHGNVKTIGARFYEGRWYGDGTKWDLTEQLTDQAVWTETFLSTESSGPLIEKPTEPAVSLDPETYA